MLLAALTWIDHGFIAGYLLAMIGVGFYASRRQKSEDEYFLGSRRMPWWAVGMSVIASLLSSLTYLAEPGEVWISGLTSYAGKMLAIPCEMLLVWLVIIPFITRFRYTSAYEYLDARFGAAARTVGVALFLLLVVAWTGFIVLATSRAVETATGVALWQIIATLGVVATVYTVVGGLRAVIWTDVCQVVLMVGGVAFVIGYVAWTTASTPLEWYAELQKSHVGGMPLVSFNPFERATIVTAAMSMFVWHVCTHLSNQITVQRYFSTADTRAARRSFVTGSLMGVLINTLLMLTGLAIFHFYQQPQHDLPAGIDLELRQHADKVFPLFMMDHLPPGMAGMLLAAILAAAMSSIDSGINSMATVMTVEYERRRGERRVAGATGHVRSAMILTLVLGVFMTIAAYLLNYVPANANLFEMMPKTFNCYLTPLASMFFIGMFVPRAGSASAILAAAAGMATSIVLAYPQPFGLVDTAGRGISFTLVMPGSLAVAIFVGSLASLFEPRRARDESRLTWFGRGSS